MTIVLIALFFLILCRSRICNNGYDDYMSREQTQMINGIFLILVFMRHFAFAICAYCRDVNLILNQFYYLLFVLVIVLLSMRVKLDSSTLLWCGQNLLGLYILQRIPMLLCKEWELTLNPYLSLFVCIVVTIFLAVAFRKYVIGKVRI